MVKVRITLSVAPKVACTPGMLGLAVRRWVEESVVGGIQEVINLEGEVMDELYFPPNDEIENAWTVEVIE